MSCFLLKFSARNVEMGASSGIFNIFLKFINLGKALFAKILSVIDNLQKRSDYEEEHKDEISDNERMLTITRDTGRFYNLLLKNMGAKRILEIGLSHGYSTLWFADAVLSGNPGDSDIVTIEKDDIKVKIANENFRKAGIENFVTIKHGEATNVLNGMLEKFNKLSHQTYFDFVFIDADKENSIKYFDLCFPMVRKNGIIAADNVLDMKEMEDYAAYVRNNEKIQTITLPIGWGQEISLKTHD